MTHQEMVDALRHGLTKEFVVFTELAANPAPPFIMGLRRLKTEYRQHIYLIYTEQEFLSAPCSLTANSIRVQQLIRAIHWPGLDYEKEYPFALDDRHVRMVVPNTLACRKKLKSLAQSNSDWLQYCLLLDSSAETLIADTASEESFLSIRDNTSTDDKEAIGQETSDGNARTARCPVEKVCSLRM